MVTYNFKFMFLSASYINPYDAHFYRGCCGFNCILPPPTPTPNPYIKTSQNMTRFRDKIFKEVTKLKWCP